MRTLVNHRSHYRSQHWQSLSGRMWHGQAPAVQGVLRAAGAQAKLTVGAPNDAYEREADRIADQVTAMPTGTQDAPQIQRRCKKCEEEEQQLQRKALPGSDAHGASGTSALSGINGAGRPLSPASRAYFEPRFGVDLSRVRIHTGTQAHAANRALNAKAFTLGNDIVFSEGQYQPESSAGRHLLAHELTHTIQQDRGVPHQIQRTFCTPYATDEEADDAEWWIRNTYMRAEGVESFGTEVYNLYDSYLNRTPGDSLTPRVFDSDSSYIHNCFQDDGYIKDDMDDVIDLVYARRHLTPGGTRSLGVSPSYMNLTNFLSTSEMDNRPINFSNPFSVSGHIAGGIGSSDAGDDYRKIDRATVAISKNDVIGSTGYYKIELFPHYEVFDTIDFCPGDPGSPLEQLITVPMSRLEASDRAYDMPFKVVFSPESRSKRFWY